MQLSHQLKCALRDCDIDRLDYQDDIVLLRALQFGELSDIDFLIKQLGREYIIDFIREKCHQLDNKSLNFWKQYFDIKDLDHSTPSIYEQLNTPVFVRNIR